MKNLNFIIRDIEEKDTNIQFDTGFKPFGIVKGYGYLKYKKQGWSVRVAVVKINKTEKIIGISTFKIENRGVSLRRLGVDKNYQDRGIGTKLVFEIKRFVEKEGLKYIKLLAHVGSIEFYSDLGFSIASPVKESTKWGYFVEMKLELF